MAKVIHTAMGRKVQYNSPPKHPEQGDPYAEIDRMTEQATRANPSTLKGARDVMKPMQKESASPAQGLMQYLKKLGGGK